MYADIYAYIYMCKINYKLRVCVSTAALLVAASKAAAVPTPVEGMNTESVTDSPPTAGHAEGDTELIRAPVFRTRVQVSSLRDDSRA